MPWFVKKVDGEYDFRFMDQDKWVRAVHEKLCWVCGEPLGVWLAFLIGPMCGINRTTSEPPAHRECATWSAINCPFMSRPSMDRREDESTRDARCGMAGIPILRNPGIGLVWITKSYQIFQAPNGPLIRIGPAEGGVEWWAEGKPATRAQVEAAVDGGLPFIEEAAKQDGIKGLEEMAKFKEAFTHLYPLV